MSDAESITREAAPYRNMTPEERARVLAAACRSVAPLLGLHADPRCVNDFVDALPQSTLKALERLRLEATGAKRT